MKTTINNKFLEILAKYRSDDQESIAEMTQLEKLVVHAYEYGIWAGVRDVADQASEKYNAQRNRAKNCRYHKMALDVVGEPDRWSHTFTYHPAYSGDFADIYSDEVWTED